MEEEKKTETSDTVIKTEDGVKVQTPAQTDALAQLKAREEEIERLKKERNDFFVGMKKYKKLAKETTTEEDEEEISSEDRMRQLVREELLNSEIGKKEAEHKAMIEKMAIENSELKRAIGNKSQISNLPGGASQESVTSDVRLEGWTPEQVEYFKAVEKQLPPGVKLDPQKVMDNWKKLIKK